MITLALALDLALARIVLDAVLAELDALLADARPAPWGWDSLENPR